MSSSQVSNQAKGLVFEKVVIQLLRKNEYESIRPDNEQVDDHGRVRGRGEWHQIDALGRWKYSIPFVYPIRLLCEAKCLKDPVNLPIIRNFVGVVKDVSENYFVEDNQDIDKRMLSKRFTDCGAIFSVSDFTENAQRYAYAHCIFLVSYKNNPIVDEFKQLMENTARFLKISRKMNKKRFFRWFDQVWNQYYPPNSNRFVSNGEDFEGSLRILQDRIDQIGTSVMGIATGVYPIHLLSHDKIPHDLFERTDEVYFRTTYRRIEGGGHYFEIFPSDFPKTKFYFTVPEYVLLKYRDSMRRFKMDFLEWIDVPVTLGSIRRLLRFKLDMEWLNSLDENERRVREIDPRIRALIRSL